MPRHADTITALATGLLAAHALTQSLREFGAALPRSVSVHNDGEVDLAYFVHRHPLAADEYRDAIYALAGLLGAAGRERIGLVTNDRTQYLEVSGTYTGAPVRAVAMGFPEMFHLCPVTACRCGA